MSLSLVLERRIVAMTAISVCHLYSIAIRCRNEKLRCLLRSMKRDSTATAVFDVLYTYEKNPKI